MKITDIITETAAWKRKAGKNKKGGLNRKGVASYRREHPGSKLQTAVTTKPSKLKKGSKASKRRKSFCARMGGVKGPMKKPNGKPTRKALALRKWHCESVDQLEHMLVLAESADKQNKNNAFVQDHIQWVADQVGITQLPKIVLLDQPRETTFGQYVPDEKIIYLVTGGRHPVDVLRTLAHELTHYKQDSEDNLPPGAGNTGTEQENEANATAGIVMRDFANKRPEYFGLKNKGKQNANI